MASINKKRLAEISQAVAEGKKLLIADGSNYKLIDVTDFVKGRDRKVCTCRLKVGDVVNDKDKGKSKLSAIQSEGYSDKTGSEKGSQKYL